MLFAAHSAANNGYIRRNILMARYIHQLKDWPAFSWQAAALAPLLASIHRRQGKLLGSLEQLGFSVLEKASFENLARDVIKSSEIEGEFLNNDQVRSSIARKLGIDMPGMVPADRHVDGIVEMMLDATRGYQQPLTAERLFGWHAAMFPGGYSGMHKIVTGYWRNNAKNDPMQVVSGPLNRQQVHFQAPDADVLPVEMENFLDWFNNNSQQDPLVKAAVSHLWFVTIHPFDDGNGRIARAITDMQLARADGTPHRFYSVSTQIQAERKAYYHALEKAQSESLEITAWIEWFLNCFNRALDTTELTLQMVSFKAGFWKQHAGTPLNTRQVLMLNKLLDGFEGKLNSSKWSKITKSSSDTAIRDIKDLILKGMLQQEEAGGRSTSYIIPQNSPQVTRH